MQSLSPPSDPGEVSEPFHPVVERAIGIAGRPLGWMWRHGFRFLIVLDAIGLFAAMGAINLVRFGLSWPTYPLPHYFVGFAIATAVHLTVNYFAGLYEREPRLGYRPWLPRVSSATIVAVAFDGLITLLTGRYLMPRANLAALAVVGAIVLVVNRWTSRMLANKRRGPSRVILVGGGEARTIAAAHFRQASDANVVGNASLASELFDQVNVHSATDVLLLDLDAFSAAFPEPLTSLDRSGIGVHQRVSAVETLLGLQSVREIAGLPFTRMRTHGMATHQLRLKRLFDVCAITLSAPIWIPVVALLAAYVRIVAGRQVLYRQARVGFAGRPFSIAKFRTMRIDAEADGQAVLSSGESDDRVIPSLRWMRKTRADELPQLWNVLRGEMSLVGPRPERPELIAEIEQDVVGYSRRHELPPGITGFAQVSGRYDTDAAFKLGYDLQYLVNWSLALDLQILARTVWVVLARRV